MGALRVPFTLGPPLGLGGTLGRRSGQASQSLYIFSPVENRCGPWGSTGAEEAGGTKARGCVPRTGARGPRALAESTARARRHGAGCPAPQSLMGQKGCWRLPGVMGATWLSPDGQEPRPHRLTRPGAAPAARWKGPAKSVPGGKVGWHGRPGLTATAMQSAKSPGLLIRPAPCLFPNPRLAALSVRQVVGHLSGWPRGEGPGGWECGLARPGLPRALALPLTRRKESVRDNSRLVERF